MPLNYIPPKNMITEEFLGNPSPQGNVFLQPVIMGPKYNVHYRELIDSSTVSYSTPALSIDVPTVSSITASETKLYDEVPWKLYATGTRMYELVKTPWGASNADISLNSATGGISIADYDAAKERMAVIYSADNIDLDADTREGTRYLKITADASSIRTYEYYDSNANFSTLLPGAPTTVYNIAVGRGTSTSGTLTEEDTATTPAYIKVTGVEGSKITFTVDYTGGDIVAANLATAIDAGALPYTVKAADTVDGSTYTVPITYIQVSAELVEGANVASNIPLHVSYAELDMTSKDDGVITITYPEVSTYFPVDTIADKLGKMVYTAFQSGASTVSFYALPYDEDYDNTDQTELQNALTAIGESKAYFIVNYDHKDASHPYIRDFIAQYADETVSKPMTAIFSYDYEAHAGQSYDADTKYTIANTINTYAQNLDDRRIVLMWPDKVGMFSGNVYYDDEFDALINSSTYGNVVEGGGMYAAAAYAGLRASQKPQQGLTNSIMKALAYVKHSSDMFAKTLPDQPLNIIASGGVTVLYQETPTSYVTVYHQLSTDMSDVRKKEFNKTVCYDYAAYYLLSISPQRGTQSWTAPVIAYEVGLMYAGCKELVKDGVLTYAEVGKPVLNNDELDIPIVVESPTPDNYKVINLKIRG